MSACDDVEASAHSPETRHFGGNAAHPGAFRTALLRSGGEEVIVMRHNGFPVLGGDNEDDGENSGH
jgi:hypothetical protein